MANHEVVELCEEFWRYLLSESPEFVTYCGFSQREEYAHTNRELDRFTLDMYERRKKFCAAHLKKCATVDRRNLSRSSTLSLMILETYISSCLRGLQFEGYLLAVQRYDFPHATFQRITLPRMRFTTLRDYEDYCFRLSKFPQQVDDFIELLNIGSKKGIVQHELAVSSIPEALESQMQFTPEEQVCYAPFKRIPASFNEETKLELQKKGLDLVRDSVQVSMATLRDFLLETYYPNLRADMAISSLPGGMARYRATLRFYIDVDLTPEEAHEIGLREVNQLKLKIRKIMEQMGFPSDKGLQKFVQFLTERDDAFFTSGSQLVEYCHDFLEKKVHPTLGRLFGEIPHYPLEMECTPEVTGGSVAVYSAPTMDSGQPGRLRLCAGEIKECPRWELPSILLHEANPGHHLQASFSVAQKQLPLFRRLKDDRRYAEAPGRFPMNAAYSEGWGLYCEELGYELGLYEDPLIEFGYCCQNLIRAVRLVVDTGIHGLGWTYEQSDVYMEENTTLSALRRTAEIARYVCAPGQACAYTMGLLKFKELRALSENKLGSLFDIRDFHRSCLECGQVPLTILEEIIDEYISTTLN